MEASNGIQEPEIGLVGRMIRVFYAPAETYEAVQRGHTWLDWFVPVLLVAAAAAVSTQLTMPLLVDMQAKAMEEQLGSNPNLTPEQKAQQREMMGKMSGAMGTVTVVMAPLSSFAMLFIFAGVYLLIGRFVLGGDVTYGQMLAVHAYASLITILQLIVLTPIRQAKGTMILALGPGLLLGEEMAGTFVGDMINAIDIFVLWQIGVAAVGLAVLSRAAMGKALTSLLVLWVLYLLAAGAFGGFMPGN